MIVWRLIEPTSNCTFINDSTISAVGLASSAGTSFLENNQDLLQRPCLSLHGGANVTKWQKVTELKCTSCHILEQVEEAPEIPVQWDGDQSALIDRCVAMVREWQGKVAPGDPIYRDFGNIV